MAHRKGKRAAPKKATPKKSAPKRAAPKKTASKKTAKKTVAKKVALKKEYYGYGVRKPYPGEDSYFMANPHVAWMAGEDNRIVLNPYSPNNAKQQDSVAKNEGIRLWMRSTGFDPKFDLTDAQKQAFAGTAYGKPENAVYARRSLVARSLAGDSSAGKFTAKQEKWAALVDANLPDEQKKNPRAKRRR